MSKITLERPDLLKTSPLRPLGWLGERHLLRFANEAARGSDYQPNIAIVVRTKNDKLGLTRILNHVKGERKQYAGRIDVIVVDTESTDGTQKIAKDFGATVVPITQKEFTYPKSVNFGLRVVKPDVVAAFITVGHAQPALSNCLSASARHFNDQNVAGVFAYSLPSELGNFLNQISFNFFTFALRQPAHPIKKFYMGALANTNSMIRMSLWRRHHYSNDFAGGGEDQEWGKWALAEGYKIIYEPTATVHHSHPLNMVNDLRQRMHWIKVYSNPTSFSTEKVAGRRPELFR